MIQSYPSLLHVLWFAYNFMNQDGWHIYKSSSKVEKQFVEESVGNREFGIIKIQLASNTYIFS